MSRRVRVQVDFELEFDRELASLPEFLEDVSWSDAVRRGVGEGLATRGVVGIVPGRRELTLVDDAPEVSSRRRGGRRG